MVVNVTPKVTRKIDIVSKIIIMVVNLTILPRVRGVFLMLCRFILFDADGSFSGHGPSTFVVPQGNPVLLPPLPVLALQCTFHTEWAAYACSNVCYRRYTLITMFWGV